MTNRLPTFSALDRAKFCPGSCALPQTQSLSKYADKGIAVHDFVLSKKRGDEKLPDIPADYRAFCETIEIEAIPVGCYEVAFGFDVDTGLSRVLGENLHREYPADVRAGELVGSADIYDKIHIGQAEAIYLGDVKTGLAEHVPPVRDCLQVGVAALAAARVERVPLAVTEIIRITDSGSIRRETAILDAWALDAIELEVREVVRRVREMAAVADSGGQVTVFTGQHCKFCPAFIHCPAQKALVVRMAMNPQSIEKEIMTMLTPETAKLAYFKYKQVQDLLNRVRNTIYGYAEQQEIDLGNGMVLGPVRMVRPKIDATLAHRIISRDYGVAAANKVVEWRTSKKAIKGVLRETCKYGTLAKTEQKVLTELRLEGGLTEIERLEVRAHRAGTDRQDAEDE